jgi:hypothetical protein
MSSFKTIRKENRQDDLVEGVGKNMLARAQDVNPIIVYVNNIEAKDFANDAAAAAGGVELGELYHNAGAVRIRIV